MQIAKNQIEDYELLEVFNPDYDETILVKSINIYDLYYIDTLLNNIYKNKPNKEDIYITNDDFKYLDDVIYLSITGNLSKRDILNNCNLKELTDRINRRISVIGVNVGGIRIIYNKNEYNHIIKNLQNIIDDQVDLIFKQNGIND